MKAHGRQVLAAATLLAIVGLGCSGPEEKKGDHEIWFMGSIYDGATGMVVSGYEISLTYGPTTIRGKVDGNGRYTVGPLPAWNDYAIQISAPVLPPVHLVQLGHRAAHAAAGVPGTPTSITRAPRRRSTSTPTCSRTACR